MKRHWVRLQLRFEAPLFEADNAIEQSDLKNMGIIVGILFVGVKKNVLDRGNLRPHKHNVYVN